MICEPRVAEHVMTGYFVLLEVGGMDFEMLFIIGLYFGTRGSLAPCL